jgi:hypothetical protein
VDFDHSLQRCHGSYRLVYRHARALILKLLAFSALLVTLVGLVWQIPILWELALVVLIGATYWIFFRSRLIPNDQAGISGTSISSSCRMRSFSSNFRFKTSDQQVIGGRSLDKVANHQIEIAMLDLKLV